MDLGLQDRVYVVTGGSRGLGRAGAAALVADGARVLLSGRDPDRLSATTDELAADGGADRVLAVAADNADPATADRLVTAARDTWGRVDGALISVGGPPAGSATETTDDAWRAAFESVFLGTVRLVRAVAAAGGAGTAVALVLSTSVRQPLANLAISNGLRPGLGMLAKTLADELGPRGVRVVGLLPGRFDTERVRELGGSAAGIPLGRLGEPAEFGRVAAFALSPAASYLTGAMVPVDGGLTRAL